MAWLMAKVGDVVVSFPLETGLERAIEELKRICRVPEEIQSLTTTVKLIKAVLKNAEEKQVSDVAVRYWLRALKQAFLDAEDLVDEITTDAALQPMGADGSKKIQRFNDRIEVLARQKDKLGLQQVTSVENRHVEYMRRQPTSSLLADATSVIGRESEQEEIKKLLLSSSCEAESSNSRNFSILPIVGMGGLGKTTLARLVYNDEKVRKHFELKKWFCVSNDSWESMQQKLRLEVEGKTFLLVLDDMWLVNQFQWDQLFEHLKFAKKGSKIMMTTRLSKAVEINQGLLGPIILRVLSDDDLWSLFKRCAFYGCSPEDYSLLEGDGREIVKKLKGLPLAAKVIGNLLNTRLELEHWREIGKSELLELEQGEDGILPALGLSYQYLPGNLRQCFAYCSLFPEDHDFDKTELTRLWDAQCYSGTEDIGNECFDNLQCRSFFEPSDYGRYVMHDLIHDLAEYVSKHDCFRLDDKKSMEIPETVRHVSVYATRIDQAKLNQLRSREKLRTLLFSDRCKFDDMTRGLDELLLKLKLLRVLGLRQCGIKELPSSVGDLKHLRYIDLAWNLFKNLPESLCDLYNLQVLDLRWCNLLVALPTRMSKLINLRHLLVSGAVVNFVSRIDGLRKLTRLQEVTVKGSKVRELGGMGMLRELEINFSTEVWTQEDAVQARLDSKEHLRELKLVWGPGRDKAFFNRELDEGTLQALQPVDSLKDLYIEGYGGVKSPSWLEDRFCLESVKLYSCLNWEVLPSLGQLGQLKSLEIQRCPKLRELPLLPPMLENLDLTDVGLTSVVGMWGCRGGGGDGEETSPSHSTSPALAHVYIRYCPNLMSLSGLLQHPLTALRVLRIQNCKELQSLVERGLGHLASLEELHITDCPKLNITCSPLLPPPLPSSLHRFQLTGCGDAMGGWWWGGLHQLTSLAYLHLGGCPTTAASFFLSLGRHPHHDLATTLTELQIHDCGSGNSVPSSSSPQPSSEGVFRSLTSLKRLVMCNSRHLLQEWAGGGLPSSLETLHIMGDDDLDDGYLTTCLRDLTSLTRLSISHCLALTSLPDCLRDLTCLQSLSISHCRALKSLPDCLRDLTFLTDLSISDCPAMNTLKDLRIDRYGGVKSPGWLESGWTCLYLESLQLFDCPNWEVLPSLGQLGRLKSLEIRDCPKLRELPLLPPMLENLDLKDVGLTSVLGMWGCRGGGGDWEETSPSHSSPPALAHVSIGSCPNLTSLNGLLQYPLTALRVLRIEECEELQSLTERSLGHLVSLQELYIIDCPKLTTTCSPLVTTLTELKIHDCGSGNSVPSSSSPQPSSGGVFRSLTSLKTLVMSRSRHLLQECAGGGLPSSLETLDIRGDDDLDDGSLATCLRDLTCLTNLSISGCPAVSSLPDCLGDLTSLTHLSISHCPALTSLSGVGVAAARSSPPSQI